MAADEAFLCGATSCLIDKKNSDFYAELSIKTNEPDLHGGRSGSIIPALWFTLGSYPILRCCPSLSSIVGAIDR